jgi:hypothetical protein
MAEVCVNYRSRRPSQMTQTEALITYIIITIINFILVTVNIHFYLKRYSTEWPSIKFR